MFSQNIKNFSFSGSLFWTKQKAKASFSEYFGPYARTQTILKSEFSTRFSPPDYIFRMHNSRPSLIRDLVPVLNQQKIILLGGRFKGGLNSDYAFLKAKCMDF